MFEPYFQKQPTEKFYKKSCSLKFRNIHRKTPLLETNFNEVAFIKKRLQHRCFLVNIAKFLRTSKYICERLLYFAVPKPMYILSN